MSQHGPEDRMGGFAIHRQPDDTTCGPTCLHAVYRHWGLDIPLPQLIREMPSLEGGGTLAVLLGIDALRRGFDATLYTYNLRLFDPTWFQDADTDIRERLQTQMKAKRGDKFRLASKAYIEFLELGGRIQYEDLSPPVLVRHLVSGHPVLCGLSATYLYRSVRERAHDCVPDDIAGEPVGHFVVLIDHDADKREVRVADPLHPPERSDNGIYEVAIDRLVAAILLGVLTYDGNLLMVSRRRES